jgi:hypothetical protein
MTMTMSSSADRSLEARHDAFLRAENEVLNTSESTTNHPEATAMMNSNETNDVEPSEAEVAWDVELDACWSGKPNSWLEAHLARAPNPNSENALFLRGVLARDAQVDFPASAVLA